MNLEVEIFFSEGEPDAIAIYVGSPDAYFDVEGYLDDPGTWQIVDAYLHKVYIGSRPFQIDLEMENICQDLRPHEAEALMQLPVERLVWQEA